MNKPAATLLQNFYRTSPQACPYVDGRAERKLITELSGSAAVALYNQLSRGGFRRSHRLAYRPACARCTECLPVRIVADRFDPGRTMRRLRQVNADLAVASHPARATPEQYRLFLGYQQARHGASDMAGMSYADYRAMIEESPLETVLVEGRDAAGRLVAVCLTDDLDDGCSAVYSFFDAEDARRSLGTWLVLQLVDRVRARGLPYVYLGYWIGSSAKMRYKTRFRPLEALRGNGWEPFEAVEAGSTPCTLDR